MLLPFLSESDDQMESNVQYRAGVGTLSLLLCVSSVQTRRFGIYVSERAKPLCLCSIKTETNVLAVLI